MNTSVVLLVIGQAVIALAFLVAARALTHCVEMLRQVNRSYLQQHKSNLAVLAKITQQDVKNFQPQPALFTAEEQVA